MGKIETKKENKRKDLLNAAFELFTTKGFTDTSIADIVSKAGIAKGTFYLYFKDKTDIRNRLISSKATQILREACTRLAQTDITKLDDQFIFLTDDILDALQNDKSLLFFLAKHLNWGMFIHSLEGDTVVSGITARELYSQLIERSDYRFENPEIIIYLIIELVAGVSYNAILYQEPVSIEELKPYLHDLIRRILNDYNQAWSG
ncbi:MAG TPA: TetR family transcriptional regulator [Lachnospiraceae bacterium]|nr:TetR family transcriptional regulator [Lachnospiraceae bacterium]